MQRRSNADRALSVGCQGRPGATLAAACMLAFAACQGDPGEEPASAGGSEPPPRDETLAADLAVVYQAGGGFDPPDWAQFSAPSPVVFDGAGRLHVLLMDAQRVLVLGADGELEHAVGRPGEGPGEFGGAAALAVWRDGRFAVMDVGNARYQVFAADGELESLVLMGAAEAGPLGALAGVSGALRADPAGDALFAVGRPRLMGRMMTAVADMFAEEFEDELGEVPDLGADDRGIERIDLGGDELKKQHVLQAWRAPMEEAPALDLGDLTDLDFSGLAEGELFHEPGFHWDVLPDGSLVWSDSSAYAIKVAPPGGEVARTFGRRFHPEPVTGAVEAGTLEDARRLCREQLEGGVVGLELAPSAGDILGLASLCEIPAETARFHHEVPVVRGLRAGWEGAVWVRRRGANPWDDEGPIDVFDGSGSYLGTFADGTLKMPDAFGPDGLVAFWETDELDIPSIVVRRLPPELR